jgi:Ca2+-binding RTX toxin-like protein
MSYVDQSDNPNISSYANLAFLQTAMVADIVALDLLYGSQVLVGENFGSENCRIGDTVYGFNTSISYSDDPILSYFSTFAPTNAYCIVDGGGTDTFDFSGWSFDQNIDLTVTELSNYLPTISSIAGLVGNLTLAVGTIIENAIGGSGSDEITGNSAANTLNGGTGADTLIGGLGNDTYVTDGGDTITEGASAGTDLVQSSATATLGSNVENLTLTGSGVINGTGNTLDNVLTGNSVYNTLDGGDGNDTLDGGTGTDTLIGGLGDDTYVTDGGDTITEDASAGTDTVQSSVTATLTSNLENLTLTGSVAINGTGNSGNNSIFGNSAANTLDGGTGTDTLIGGLGDDTYVTDGGDTITEDASAGTDLVQSSATATLGSNVENLTLTGSVAINGTGNSGNNSITGNIAANTLNGGTGADTLIGGLGNDTYVTDGGDTITEGASAGTDLVQSSATATLGSNVENLTLTGSGVINGTGNTLNNSITGNSAANRLDGGTGADTLTGGTGKDLLLGGSGNDTFIFKTVAESATTATTSDVISDFVRGQDKISLSTIDAFASSGANDTFLWKGTAAFSSTTQGEVRYQQFNNSGTANDYTMVWIDNDADTGVEMAIRLTGLYTLTASDFSL